VRNPQKDPNRLSPFLLGRAMGSGGGGRTKGFSEECNFFNKGAGEN